MGQNDEENVFLIHVYLLYINSKIHVHKDWKSDVIDLSSSEESEKHMKTISLTACTSYLQDISNIELNDCPN